MTPRADDFKLPGGQKTYGEIKEEYGEKFATKAFDLMEKIQAGEGNKDELMSLYLDFLARDHQTIVLAPVAKGGDG